MIAQRLNGRSESERLLRRLKPRVAKLPRPLTLATILVGRRYDSALYVRLKTKAARRVGIKTAPYQLPSTTSQARLEQLIKKLNRTKSVTGILLQLPLPARLNADQAIAAMSPRKDVDGFHRLTAGIVPPPIGAVLQLLRLARPKRGIHAVILGRVSVFTRQLQAHLHAAGYHTLLLPTSSRIPPAVRRADIVVTALGHGPRLTGQQVKPGAIIIDVGIRKHGTSAIGDVAPSVWTKAKAVSPVPGGVGPLTVYWVLENTYLLGKHA